MVRHLRVETTQTQPLEMGFSDSALPAPVNKLTKLNKWEGGRGQEGKGKGGGREGGKEGRERERPLNFDLLGLHPTTALTFLLSSVSHSDTVASSCLQRVRQPNPLHSNPETECKRAL